MTTELWLLLLSLPLYALYLGAQSLIYRWEYGVWHAASARDDERPPSTLLGRAERALRNFHETWPAFIIMALVAHLSDPGNSVLFWGAIVCSLGG